MLLLIIVTVMTSYTPISLKMKLCGGTKPRD